jgi:predicted ester cyclase
MAQAREVMDKVTAAVVAHDTEALRRLYAAEAVAVTPDIGEVKGRDAVVDWINEFTIAFPDVHFELVGQYEDGDVAIDEGYFVGTHKGPLPMPTGDLAPTGRQVRLRECDIAVVSDGLVSEHRFYYDQAEFMAQLGVTPA